jgi:hypothetical protein
VVVVVVVRVVVVAQLDVAQLVVVLVCQIRTNLRKAWSLLDFLLVSRSCNAF